MTVSLKGREEIELMAEAGRIVGNTLLKLRESARAGISTQELDAVAEVAIREQGAEPAFPYVDNFPANVCIAVNNEVVHGIPGQRVLAHGDIVKFDVGAVYKGYFADAAITVPVGVVDTAAQELIRITERALEVGIDAAQEGKYLFDIGSAIADCVEPAGYSIVREYVGHGIGRHLHEEPDVPHFRQSARGLRLRSGMVFTIEPIINIGGADTDVMADGWTVVTQDGSLSAQFEHTIAITDAGTVVLTQPDGHVARNIPKLVPNRVQC